MRKGVVVTAHPGVEELAVQAEELGLDSLWVIDSPMHRRGTTPTTPDRHTKIYPNYLGRIAPEDRDLAVPSLMNQLALVGTRDQLLARITTLEQAGIDELLIQPVVDPPTEMAQFAKLLQHPLKESGLASPWHSSASEVRRG